MRKHQRDTASRTSYLSLSTGETGLTGGTRVSVTPEKRIPKNKKHIKSLPLTQFIPGNIILLNDENDHNPKTTDTSLYEKDDMSYTSRDDFIEKAKDKRKLMMMTNTKRNIRNIRTVMKVLIILKL